MRTYIYILIPLLLAGITISAFQTMQHYDPTLLSGTMFCGGNSCLDFNQWEYSVFLGIPVSLWGLFFYILMIFTIFIADYAMDDYYIYCLAVLMPASALSLIIDLLLAVKIFYDTGICVLCLLSYAVNILVFAVLVRWYKRLSRDYFINFMEILLTTFRGIRYNAHKKAAFTLYLFFVFLMIIIVFAAAGNFEAKSYNPAPSGKSVNAVVKKFFSSEPLELKLPESKMTIGSPGAHVKMIVFADFLSSSCNRFYLVQRYLMAKYRKDLSIVFYNYPLDRHCNPYMERTLYRNSCEAARAATASASLGLFNEYYINHFEAYDDFNGEFDEKTAVSIASVLIPVFKDKFRKEYRSKDTDDIIRRDAALAKKLGINAAPTVFLNGRKMTGVFPREVYDEIILKELTRKK